jgi:hypothetical protein
MRMAGNLHITQVLRVRMKFLDFAAGFGITRGVLKRPAGAGSVGGGSSIVLSISKESRVPNTFDRIRSKDCLNQHAVLRISNQMHLSILDFQKLPNNLNIQPRLENVNKVKNVLRT